MPTPYRNTKGRFRTPTPDERDVDIRAASDIPKLEGMLSSGGITFVLVYADWCGHCHRYLPTWSELEKTPGRTAHMARVHHDMVDQVPALKAAKLQGYPSVVKVLPDGRLESYTDAGEQTNAMPTMRDTATMQKELTKPALAPLPMKGGGAGGSGDYFPLADKLALEPSSAQSGGSVLDAFVGAVQQAGPAAILALAYAATQGRKNKSKTRKQGGGTRRRMRRRSNTRRRRA